MSLQSLCAQVASIYSLGDLQSPGLEAPQRQLQTIANYTIVYMRGHAMQAGICSSARGNVSILFTLRTSTYLVVCTSPT